MEENNKVEMTPVLAQQDLREGNRRFVDSRKKET